MIIGYIGTALAILLCIIFKENLFIYSGLLKFFINTSIGIVSVYTSEVYPTHLRSLALGFGNGLTRVGGITTPFLCEMMDSYFTRGPFYMFFLLCLLGVIGTYLLPYDTMGMKLDNIENKCVIQEQITNEKIKYKI